LRDSTSACSVGVTAGPLLLQDLPCSSGIGPDPCFLLLSSSLLIRPVSPREMAARRESWDVASPGATLTPDVAHATDLAVQQQRAASVGDDPRLCASRIRAHDDHSAAEAPEAVPLLLSSLYVEPFSCGDS
jgi:hypothetical protein